MKNWGNKWVKPIFAEIKEGTPVNAVASTLTITSEEIALLDDGDTVTFNETVYEKGAAADFENATTLAAAIDADEDWGAAESSGDVVITATVKGVEFNDVDGIINNLEDTTAGGDGAGTSATATITEEAITALEDGDTIEFDGETWTFVDGTAGADEFSDQTGLIALIDALTDWGAADSSNDVLITAATDSADFNGFDVDVTYNRVTASGVDGTPGKAGSAFRDGSALYVLHVDNGINDANWEKITYDS